MYMHLLVDIVTLAWLVGWSGGIENPFASLFLLPMALSHATVERLNGELSMQSPSVGEGVRVTFRLPGTVHA